MNWKRLIGWFRGSSGKPLPPISIASERIRAVELGMITSASIPSDSNNCDISGVGGADANGNSLPLSALTAELSDYTDAFLTVNNASSVSVWKRPGLAPGKTFTFNAMFNGKSQDGTPLPQLSIPVTITTPGVPQATQIIAGTTSTHNSALPADPGTSPQTMI